MSRLWSISLLMAVVTTGCRPASQLSIATTAMAAEPAPPLAVSAAAEHPRSGYLEIPGTTLPAPGRISEITAAVMHPVMRILVKPGDFVRTGQRLIEIDSDEPEADVRAKQAEVEELKSALARLKSMPRAEERAEARAQLESAQIASKAARAYLERLAALREHDAVSAREYSTQKTTLLRAEADEKAAQAHLDVLLKQPIEHEIAETAARLAVADAELDAAEAELEHYVLHASIDGVVCWLDVTPGTVNRAGTKVWGEIVDLQEVDVKVEMTPRQLSMIDRLQPVHIRQPEIDKSWDARFVYAAPAANHETGRIPVILRVSNTEEQLRCHLNVLAQFKLAASGGEAKTAASASLAIQGAPAK
jgi:multidrug efflux pump subunit AcrA (membrane-fusion protein)